ncbi:MAG: 23S rRNA (guanosine2251-2'-O)-methyltransferase, partial [Cellvibrionaceae bacterium]
MQKFKDSLSYPEKKAFFRQVITVYGRKPVLEALQNSSLTCLKLHLATSNNSSTILDSILHEAALQQLEVVHHDRQALSRISKNRKQDQGVCLDVYCPDHRELSDYLQTLQQRPFARKQRLLAVDGITNPQNLGMLIRTACAGDINGILIAEKGSAKLDALTIKASAGTIFRAPILRCQQLDEALKLCRQDYRAEVIGLSSRGEISLADYLEPDLVIYVLGNETRGISDLVAKQCN